jgi:cytoskeletal protein CcmA (bactofilin family)
MALVINDRVKETSTTTGTGTLNLSGAVTGFETFVAGVGNGNTTYYAIVNRDADEWEVGLGTVTDASTDTLARTTVITSSNSDSATDFSAGTKDVFVTLPASKVTFEDASSDVTLPNDLILGSDSAVLKFGADSDTTLTHTDGTGLTLNSTNKLLFRDTGLYINSSTDGQLDIVADTEVQIAATTIDINGAVALNGAITGATNITLSGELDAATLDISGDADIDGTLEADAITINGATLAETVTDLVGGMVSSNTETGITVTFQDGDNTLDFALGAAQTTITSLLATDIKIGEDDQTKIDFETADEIHFYANNTEQVYVGDNIFGPQSDSDVDLGATGVRWKDAFVDSITVTGEVDGASLDISGNADIDGTLEADAITVDGTALATFIRDTVGTNMVSSNTETGISVTYDTTNDNLDFAIAAAQTTITSLLATDIKIGEDDETKIDFETADEIHFYAANVEQVYVGDNIFGPQSDSDVDLGSTGVRWKDAFVDTITTTGNATVGGDLTVTGDDITMGTNTDTAILVADGTNYNPVVPSGDVGLTNAGVFSIASGVIVNADVNASAAIADSKLATISTANKVDIGALDIDGATDIGEALADADLFIVDNGAGGTERKMAASRIVTYVDANSSAATVGKAIAMAIVFG